MANRESTAVGFRIRGIEPTDLGTYPDSVKLLWWGWVLDSALRVKDRELAKGWDKDGNVHPLKPATIKHRESEVGPTFKRAPRLEPSYARSRVRSLLRGRAHTTSCELFWGFDAVTGASFARVLHFSAEVGHDVFGITPGGIARIRSQALAKWQAWKASAGYAKGPANVPGARPVAKREVRGRNGVGRTDIENFDLAGDESLVRRAIEKGTFTGFRRLNARGEKWTPGTGLGPARRPPRQPVRPAPGPINLPVTRFIPAAPVVPIVSREQIDALVKTATAAHVSTVPVGLLRVQSDRVGALQDLVNKRIVEWYRDHPSSEPIVVIFEQGKFFIHEGHHRSAAAAMRGSFSIPGLIFRRKPGTRNEAELLVMDENGNLHAVGDSP
jgi:hypothetical protein